jgi:two-component system NtrC family sensor kinase
MDPDDSRMILLANLQREAEKMEKIVNNLLHFTRRYKARLARCDLADVVRKSVESVGHRLRKKQMNVDIHLSGAASEAHADADLLQQVFGNILANAIDASPAGSCIHVELAVGAAPETVAVTVRDPGEGIPAELIDRVFDPFYTSKVNGVGLGLSVTRKIIDAHGGRIEVASQPGKGTAFKVLLPREPQPQPAEVAA